MTFGVAGAIVATAGIGLAIAQDKAAPTTAAKPAAFRGDTRLGPILLRKPMAPAKVQWQAAMSRANQMRTAVRVNSLAARLPKADLDKTRLPVLLPRSGGPVDIAAAKMVSFGDAYALNMPQPKGVQITMYGNRSFVPAEAGAVSKKPVQRLLGVAEDVRISQMEDGWTATFTRYGVVYSLDVSCDDINSADCQTDTYIRNAIAQFDDVTMGAQAQAEAGVPVTAQPQPNVIDQAGAVFSKLVKGK